MRLFKAALLLFILSNCGGKAKNIEQQILGIWRLSSYENSKQDKGNTNDPLLAEASKFEKAKEGIVLSIFPDHQYTVLKGEGEYEYGNWSFDQAKNKITFKNKAKNQHFEVAIADLENDLPQLKLLNQHEKFAYLQEAKLLKNYKEEPFHPSNNLWRIKANHLESKQEIIDRLGEYFKHMAYLLKAADQRNLKVISFEYSMGIIRIYNGGIGIVPVENIPQIWKDTYYNEEQVLLAHFLYEFYLDNFKYHGAGTGDWVKDDYTIMLNIYNDLKAGKFVADN
jgi:hypothetical protein